MKRIAILIIITLMLSFSGCKNNPTTPKTNNPPVINILSISPTTINKGESATLSWNVTNSTSVSIDQGVGSVAASGSRSMNPDNDTVYTLTASNNDGTVTKSCEIKVKQPSKPVINSFSISPTTINKGESATLSWDVTNATSVSIDQGVGSVAASGSRSINPDKDTVYTLTASNNDGTVTKSCEIKVLQPPITTVYITATGTKYHLDGCQYLSDSKIAISLVDACKKGYGPCSVCKPPPCPESFHYEDK